MKAVDTSVIVAALAAWHTSHARATGVLDARPVLLAHCALETYSVLTRLPVPHRMDAAVVASLLASSFSKPPLVLPAAELRALPSKLAGLEITGGAVYDALVATTAHHHGVTLVTMDTRALATYRKIGVRAEFVEPVEPGEPPGR